MNFVEQQLHNRLSVLAENHSREELEQAFDEVVNDVIQSNLDFVDSLGISSSEYSKRGQYIRNSLFNERTYYEKMGAYKGRT